jgi:phosphoribosylformylglycinamidine synthase subunit PurQ / glutaminase
LKTNRQVALRYARPDETSVRKGSPQIRANPDYLPAGGQFPHNFNGFLDDIAGICDETGRIFGLMPHPEAFHQLTNHPDWTRLVDHRHRWGFSEPEWDGDGMKIFQNAVAYAAENLTERNS